MKILVWITAGLALLKRSMTGNLEMAVVFAVGAALLLGLMYWLERAKPANKSLAVSHHAPKLLALPLLA
jgi:hypothetical protein